MAGDFVSRYIAYASRCTSAPEVYHRVVALGLMAAALKRRVWMDFAGDRLYPNLWFCLLGDSGALHKSTAINLGVRVLRGLGEDALYPSDFSLQRLYDTMKQRPQGTLVYREFRALADMLDRDYMAGTKAVLTDLYDCPAYVEYDTKSAGLIKVSDPCLNLWAASTLTWFTGRQTQRDLAAGFLARFAWVPARVPECAKEDPLPEGAESTGGLRDALAAELRNIGLSSGRMRLSDGAAAAYRALHAIHREQSGLAKAMLLPFMVRYEVLALKLAMLWHLATGRDAQSPIGADAVTDGFLLVNGLEWRLIHAMEDEVAFTVYEEQRLKVLKMVPNGQGEITQRDLLRGSRLRLRDLSAILETLRAEGTLVSRFERVRGETKTWWARAPQASA